MANHSDAVLVPRSGFVLNLLGTFQFIPLDGDPKGAPLRFPTRKLESLLAYLVLHRTAPISRQQLAFLLYPDSEDTQARTNLRLLLHRLRTSLPYAERLIDSDAQNVWWRTDAPVRVDVIEFERTIAEADQTANSRAHSAARTALEHAVVMYQGDLLPDCYDDWIEPERERLQGIFVYVLERLIGTYGQAREYSNAVATANRLLGIDQFSETAYLALMRSHAALGERGAALRAYHRCVTIFQQELSAEPGQALRDAYTQLLSANLDTAPVLTLQAPLVGRDAEWQHLRTAWTRAASGPPKLLLLTGEAGIGKTRLTEELTIWARRQSVTALATACYASENSLPYAPILAWLRAPEIVPARTQLEPNWRQELRVLLPEISDTQSAGELVPLPPSWQRQRLFEAMARALLATTQPLLLAIDDAQWADRDTLEWLHYLLHYASTPLLIVATARSEELDENTALVALRDDLRHADRLSEIALGTLSRHDTFQLAQHLSAQPLDSIHAERLFAETEGNPLFVVEIMRAGMTGDEPATGARKLQDNHPLSSEALLPPKVMAVIERRLAHISPAAHQVLDTAAVIGHSFSFAVLKYAAQTAEENIVDGLDELWRRRIVREYGTFQYDFTHDKLRAVAYANLSSARRRIVHRRVAEALEQANRAQPDAVAAPLALHYERAGNFTRAISMYRRTGEIATRLYANTDALDNFERALQLLDRADVELGEIERETVRAEISAQGGEVLFLLGRYEEARTAFELARSSSNESNGIWRAELYRKLGNCWRELHRYPEALNTYDRATVALETNASPIAQLWQTRIEIEFDRFNIYYWLGDFSSIRTLITLLQSWVEQYASPPQRARFYQTKAIATLRLGRYTASDEAVTAARNYLTMLEAAGDSVWLQSAHFQLGFTLLWQGDMGAAEREMLTALDLARARGDVSLHARCLTYLTVARRLRGDLEQTRVYAEQSLEFAARAQMNDYIGAAHGNRAWLAWRKSDVKQTLEEGHLALEAWQKLPNAYMFQWLALLPLIAASLQTNALENALSFAATLVQASQQRMPLELETLFARALKAAKNDLAAARASLRQSLTPARKFNML